MALRIVTINIPQPYIDALKLLVDIGLYNSRSEIVRECVKDLLDKDQSFFSDLIKDKLKILGASIK